MTNKLFSNSIRLVVSLSCVLGFSALYGRVYCAPDFSYNQGKIYEQANYRPYEYGNEYGKRAQYQYSPIQYRAYSLDYSRTYGIHDDQLSNYSLAGADNYGVTWSKGGNWRMRFATYQRYVDYQSGVYETSWDVSSLETTAKVNTNTAEIADTRAVLG